MSQRPTARPQGRSERLQSRLQRGAPPWPLRAGAVLVLLGASTAVFLLLAAHGAEQAERGVRVLPSLDPFIEVVRRSGRGCIDWLMGHGAVLGGTVTGAAVVLVTTALVATGRRALPLVLLGASIACATWGQAWLWVDQIPYGTALYLAGMALALALGIWCPASQWRVREPAPPAPTRLLRAECGLILQLVGRALLVRLYALPELPNIFAGEMAFSMLASRTSAGVYRYIPEALGGNSTGLWHLVPQMAFYKLFGTSIYSLRLTAVAFGITVVPLFYWVLRRLSGRRTALIGTLLLLAAPEQLWWSRAENTYFEATMLLGVISALLGTWMLERFSFPTVCAGALWMPFTRHFYLAGIAMMAYPWLLYGHAVVFVRRVWRTAWYGVPVLVAGTLLWAISMSVVYWLVNGGYWRFVNPAFHGESFVHRPGTETLGLTEVAWQQAVSLARNLSTVAQYMTYNGGGEYWYKRADALHHSTVINAGVVVVLAVGLGYLLAQVFVPRAFALLMWLALGVLPGLLSTSPVPRRITVAFPAIYAIAAVSVDAFLRITRERGGRVAAWLAGGFTSVALAAIVWTSLASHFALPIAPVPFDPVFRFSKALFDESDAVYHNVDGTMSFLLAFASADRLVAPDSTPCFQYVGPRDWLAVALRQPCGFTEPAYTFSLPRARIEALRAGYRPPRRVSFLLDDHPVSLPHLAQLRALFPEAQERRVAVPDDGLRFVALSVDRAVLDARRSPTVAFAARLPADASLAERILANTRLTPVPAQPAQAATVVRAGLLLQLQGWYRFGVEPACPAASVTIDQQPTGPGKPPQPLLAGIHEFELTLPSLGACALPLQLKAESSGAGTEPADTAPLLLAPALASRSELRAAPALSYDGYGEVSQFAGIRGRPWDFGVGAAGDVIVVASDGARVVMQRFDPAGREAATWTPELPPGSSVRGLVVMPDGGSVLFAGRQAFRFDRDGTLGQVWQDPLVVTTHVGVLPDGRILSAVPHYGGAALLAPDGTVTQVWRTFEGGPGTFTSPVSAATNPDGDIAVIELDGHVLLFHNSGALFAPRFVRRFHMDFTNELVGMVPLSFDGPGRLLAGDPQTARVLVYAPDGQRMLATDPARDLSNKVSHEVRRFAATGDRLYVLDGALQLWMAAR